MQSPFSLVDQDKGFDKPDRKNERSSDHAVRIESGRAASTSSLREGDAADGSPASRFAECSRNNQTTKHCVLPFAMTTQCKKACSAPYPTNKPDSRFLLKISSLSCGLKHQQVQRIVSSRVLLRHQTPFLVRGSTAFAGSKATTRAMRRASLPSGRLERASLLAAFCAVRTPTSACKLAGSPWVACRCVLP